MYCHGEIQSVIKKLTQVIQNQPTEHRGFNHVFIRLWVLETVLFVFLPITDYNNHGAGKVSLIPSHE